MKNEIQINLGTDHALECAEKIIGRSGEGLVSSLAITVPEELLAYDAYIDFEKPNGETFRTPKLEVANGVAYYDVPKYLLIESGEIKVQLVFEKSNGYTWKSSKKRYTILKSINAVDDVPEKEDLFAEIQKLVDELNQEVTEIAELLANNAKFAQAVIDACGGQTKINTINGIALKFYLGDKEEFDKYSDFEKQNVFAIFTNDTAREEILKAISSCYKLSGLEADDTHIINDTFDIEDLCNPSDSGVYVLHYQAIAYGKIAGLPSEIVANKFNVNGIKLIVEADFDETSGFYAIYHTLKVNYNNTHDGLNVYHRIYHRQTRSWDSWKQHASVEEVKAVKQELEEGLNNIANSYIKPQNYEEGGTLSGGYGYTIHNYSIGAMLSFMTSAQTVLDPPEACKVITYDKTQGKYLIMSKSYQMCSIVDLDRGLGDYLVIDGVWQYCCKIGEKQVDGETQSIWLIQRIA